MARKRKKHSKASQINKELGSDSDKDVEPNWEGTCEVCGASPIVPITGMCGPCTWGEADTVGGNW
jgi:hypothetical protein